MKKLGKLITILMLVAFIISTSMYAFAEEINVANNFEELEEIIATNLDKHTEIFEVRYTGYNHNIAVGIKGLGEYRTRVFMEEIENTVKKLTGEGTYYSGDTYFETWEAWGKAGDITLKFIFRYNHSEEEETLYAETVDKIYNQIINNDMTDLEKIGAINYYVVSNTLYNGNEDDYKDKGVKKMYSAYSVAVEGTGVCNGYALLTHSLLEKAGIEAMFVTGDSTGGRHAWNLVKLEDNWYHLDTTWNDTYTKGTEFTSYEYFLKSDRQISRTRKWNRDVFPKATDDSFKYLHDIKKAISVDGEIFYTSGGQSYKMNYTNKEKIKITNKEYKYAEDKLQQLNNVMKASIENEMYLGENDSL